ncbi:DUF397 domain-containing protein [Plantactinospora sp. WMMB334]|uniref:DUF397 domain-containing protein n=1 Tax=Plantactinospora sp. WMMB334 TaxID=3404119 RepID=UPI003B966874
MTELRGARWRKSTRSGGNGGECIEVADHLVGIVAVRDSRDPAGPVLTFPPYAWSAFVAGVKSSPPPTP